MSDDVFTRGSCCCGAISYTIRGEPLHMAMCHCTDCQKLSGTGHATNAFFKAGDVEISGEPQGYTLTADSGAQRICYFCPTCGSRLHGVGPGRPEIVLMPIGCLEDHSWFSPNVVVYTARRQAWDYTTDQVPNFEAMPPPRS